MSRAVPFLFASNLLFGTLFFGGCQTVPQGIQQARIEMAQRIAAEPAGDYFIGRRYVKPNFKFWGYVRRPGQPWSSAQLVMLNENQKLAPDREQAALAEYKRTRVSTTTTNTNSTVTSAATMSTNWSATRFILSSF